MFGLVWMHGVFLVILAGHHANLLGRYFLDEKNLMHRFSRSSNILQLTLLEVNRETMLIVVQRME
jgi:hypothetical protein